MKTRMEELAPYMRGWRSYFGFCETPEVLMGLTSLGKGFGRVGHRRVALPHVSCAPSSNWTREFPASSSPTIFFRRRAPQAGQVTLSGCSLATQIASFAVCRHGLISRALCAGLDWAGVKPSLAGAVRLPFPTLDE